MLLEKVREIVAEQLGVEVDEITMGTNLKNDLDADSLDMVEIIISLEDEFDIEIPDDDGIKIETVEDIVSYIDSAL